MKKNSSETKIDKRSKEYKALNKRRNTPTLIEKPFDYVHIVGPTMIEENKPTTYDVLVPQAKSLSQIITDQQSVIEELQKNTSVLFERITMLELKVG